MEWPPRYSENFTPNLDQEYWSPELETMPPAERDKHILAKLKRQVHYAFENSGFYQEFYKDAPVDPANLASLEEFAQLPILTKEDIRREQEEHPPYGRFLCVPPEGIFRVHGTSGTTGRPTVFGIGKEDWDRI
ncbi:MAG: phenylacetate--CoA ligase, partial [Chloroflexi bacterium]|nr:phenylacetate--CoA ligase [Chloroflexota bacterium]